MSDFLKYVGGFCVVVFCLGLCVCLPIIGCGVGWVKEANQAAHDEVGPKALLHKYGWFKDAVASLDKKQADIMVYEKRIADIEKTYEGKQRTEWAKDDREAHRQAQSELAGIKLSYNSLAAEYNAAMAKENWKFCNAGSLPDGAKVALPREFRVYMEN